MKTYRVNVNDKEYVVKIEEVSADEAARLQQEQQAKPASAAQTAPVAQAETTVSAPAANAEIVESPIQGNIFKIVTQPGDAVKAGDTLLILEAMKLENEIVAPRDGVIDAILVKEGQNVDAGIPLVSLK